MSGGLNLNKPAAFTCSFKYAWPFVTTRHQRINALCITAIIAPHEIYGLCVTATDDYLQLKINFYNILTHYMKRHSSCNLFKQKQ